MANRTRSKKRITQRKSKKRNNRSNKKSKKQRGGADFSPAQREQLLAMGFTEDHIDTLAQVFPNTDADVVMNLIDTSLGQINNNTKQPNTPQEIMDSLNPDNNENNDNDENNLSGIANSENGSENDVSVGSFAFENQNENQNENFDDSFDFYPDDDLDNNDNNLNNNISDISEDSIVSDQGDTTREDSDDELYLEDLQGGRRRKTRKGRKGRKTRKGRKGKKSRKTKKQRGGMRYGSGVGANCFDPNYSIYNTPALTLFPYKPN